MGVESSWIKLVALLPGTSERSLATYNNTRSNWLSATWRRVPTRIRPWCHPCMSSSFENSEKWMYAAQRPASLWYFDAAALSDFRRSEQYMLGSSLRQVSECKWRWGGRRWAKRGGWEYILKVTVRAGLLDLWDGDLLENFKPSGGTKRHAFPSVLCWEKCRGTRRKSQWLAQKTQGRLRLEWQCFGDGGGGCGMCLERRWQIKCGVQ